MKTVIVYLTLPVVSVVCGESVTLKQTRFDEEVDFDPFPMNACLLGRVLSTDYSAHLNRYRLPYLMPCHFCCLIARIQCSPAHKPTLGLPHEY